MFPRNSTFLQPENTFWPSSFSLVNTPTMSIPKWFISRGAGVYTALIPADELPLSVNLQGVPSTMTVDQVGGMTFIAETGPTIQRFVLDRQSPFPGQAFSDVSTASPSPIAPPLKQFCAPDAQVGGITSHQSQFNTGTEMIPKVEEAQVRRDICLNLAQGLTDSLGNY